MKRQFIIFALFVVTGIFACASWRVRLGKLPALVFEGYRVSTVEGVQLAELQLRNQTRQPMWIVYVPDYPFKPELVKPNPVSVINSRLGLGTTVYVRGQGSFSMKVEKLLPKHSMKLLWPVVSGEAPERAAVCYYFGDFKDKADFITHCWIPHPTAAAPWREKLGYFWAAMGFRAQRVVRCPIPLSFDQEYATNCVALE